jgi:hypothetical protein
VRWFMDRYGPLKSVHELDFVVDAWDGSRAGVVAELLGSGAFG